MKISYRWLGELVECGLEARELAERLTMAGLAVDAVERAGDDKIVIDLARLYDEIPDDVGYEGFNW